MLLLGCGGGGSDGGGPTGGSPVITRASSNSGDGQSGTVGLPLADSFRVVVTQGGSPAAGITVSWSSTPAGAVFGPALSLTDAQGRAATRMTLAGRAGGQTARASLTSGSVTFGVSALAGPPANLAIESGNGQAALVNSAMQFPLRVQLTDQFANPVGSSSIGWSLAAGGGSLSAPSTLTNGSGVAAVSLTAGGASESLLVRAVSAGGDTVIFTAHAVTVVKDVLVKNNFFESVANGSQAPSVDTIAVGQSMRWLWQSGAVDHNIIPQGSPLFQGISGSIISPFTFGPVFFGAPGKYHYDCNLHSGMSGIIVVQ